LIIVLEGVNGVGKSTYARLLQERLGYTPLRAFRPSSDCHFNGKYKVERDLQAFNVPYNTHVDDLYVADILGKLKPSNVVLDRSMASAVAYGSRPISDAGELVRLWAGLFGRTPVLYVWLTADPNTSLKRVVARGDASPSLSILKALHGSFELVYELVPFFKDAIDTDVTRPEDGVSRIELLASMYEAR
jgi:thymidylate kinase